MSRTFWERWRWELEKRKDMLLMNRRTYSHVVSSGEAKLWINEIDAKFLSNPTISGEQKECFLGRGSFGIVRLMMYRSLHVAVKQLHVKSFGEDVQREAEIMASLSFLSSLAYVLRPSHLGLLCNSMVFLVDLIYQLQYDVNWTSITFS